MRLFHGRRSRHCIGVLDESPTLRVSKNKPNPRINHDPISKAGIPNNSAKNPPVKGPMAAAIPIKVLYMPTYIARLSSGVMSSNRLNAAKLYPPHIKPLQKLIRTARLG